MIGSSSSLLRSPLRISRSLVARSLGSGSAPHATIATAETISASASASPFASVRRQRILSGVQPTGSLHLGNYLGAIKQWVSLQREYESFFCVVDLHAITVPQDPKKLRQETMQAAALYVAAGIDPAVSRVFVQSHVSAHAQLAWLLNCVTPMNWLERMIQYKEKAVKHGENVGVGLFDYPVLMAADILLYQTDLVPVGEDQRQHLELTRDIARRFHDQFSPQSKGKDKGKKQESVFREPRALIVKEGARVMSLQDGAAKMSKSAENDNSRINVLDDPEVIRRKIKRCKTDSFTTIEWDNPERPEAHNLLNILQAVTNKTKEEVQRDVAGMNWGVFKPYLADAIVAHLQPMQQRYHEIVRDETQLEKILAEGAEAANEVASKTLERAQEAMGFHIPKQTKR